MEVIAISKENLEVDMEIQEPENKGIDSIDQLVQVEQEETNSEEINKEFDHLMDLIASLAPEYLIRRSDERAIDQE
ncbi:hypothetical protein, partial [Corallococcus interemptor]|uniref:hypothetical protein n=1 Tax=Corallococcus interemptor TaxID=2316720 RepID=UPI0011C4846F